MTVKGIDSNRIQKRKRKLAWNTWAIAKEREDNTKKWHHTWEYNWTRSVKRTSELNSRHAYEWARGKNGLLTMMNKYKKRTIMVANKNIKETKRIHWRTVGNNH